MANDAMGSTCPLVRPYRPTLMVSSLFRSLLDDLYARIYIIFMII